MLNSVGEFDVSISSVSLALRSKYFLYAAERPRDSYCSYGSPEGEYIAPKELTLYRYSINAYP